MYRRLATPLHAARAGKSGRAPCLLKPGARRRSAAAAGYGRVPKRSMYSSDVMKALTISAAM